MSMIADKIEKFILDRMREEQEKLILKRNELADELDILMNESMKLNLEDMESCFKEGFCMGYSKSGFGSNGSILYLSIS